MRVVRCVDASYSSILFVGRIYFVKPESIGYSLRHKNKDFYWDARRFEDISDKYPLIDVLYNTGKK